MITHICDRALLLFLGQELGRRQPARRSAKPLPPLLLLLLQLLEPLRLHAS